MANKSNPKRHRAGKIAMQFFVSPRVRNRFAAACSLGGRDMVEVLSEFMTAYADERQIPHELPPPQQQPPATRKGR